MDPKPSATCSVIAPSELPEDIESIRRLVELDPAMTTLPRGFSISDGTAAQMLAVARYALDSGFQRLEAEGRGASHEAYKIAAQQFASSTLILAVDRETQLGLTTPKESVPELWNWRRSLADVDLDRNIVLTDELAAECKRDAEQALGDDGFALLEQNLSRLESFEAFRTGAEFFALATRLFAEDRQARIKGRPLTVAIQ